MKERGIYGWSWRYNGVFVEFRGYLQNGNPGSMKERVFKGVFIRWKPSCFVETSFAYYGEFPFFPYNS